MWLESNSIETGALESWECSLKRGVDTKLSSVQVRPWQALPYETIRYGRSKPRCHIHYRSRFTFRDLLKQSNCAEKHRTTWHLIAKNNSHRPSRCFFRWDIVPKKNTSSQWGQCHHLPPAHPSVSTRSVAQRTSCHLCDQGWILETWWLQGKHTGTRVSSRLLKRSSRLFILHPGEPLGSGNDWHLLRQC
jgi:hypothetical protein